MTNCILIIIQSAVIVYGSCTQQQSGGNKCDIGSAGLAEKQSEEVYGTLILSELYLHDFVTLFNQSQMAGIVAVLICASSIVMSEMALATTAHSDHPITEPSIDIYSSRWKTKLLCDNSSHYHRYHDGMEFTCLNNEPILALGYCATFNEDTRILSVSACPYHQIDGYDVLVNKHIRYIILPRNLSQLDHYMCGPLNRKGLVCSQCADGFGPSVTSIGYKCVNCTNVWYHVPLFLLLELVPITVFYLIILVFQISVTSPPMPCFIMYAQLVVIAIDYNVWLFKHITPDSNHSNWDYRLDIKIVTTLYGLFNLDFFRYNVLPPFCLSSRLDPIDVAAILGYVSALYPIILIILTWSCVELHGHNFKPLVFMWRPFHKCFIRFRRKWNTKSDLIDVFITFSLLSYNKLLFQMLLISYSSPVMNIKESGDIFRTYAVLGTSSKSVHRYLLLFAQGLTSVLFNILPLLLLFFYPSRIFRSCQSKLRLNFIAVDTFIDKVYGCYRNGLEGGSDMRRFASLYFFLRLVVCSLPRLADFTSKSIHHFYFIGTFMLTITLVVALARPYKKTYMTILDVVFLSTLTVTCYTLALNPHGILLTVRILVAVPMILLILCVTLNKLHSLFCGNRASLVRKFDWKICSTCFRNQRINSISNTPTSEQPLIHPTCTVIQYGTF